MKTYSIQDVFTFINAQPDNRAVDNRDNLHEEAGTVLTHYAESIGVAGRVHSDFHGFNCSEGTWEEKEKSGFMAALSRATLANRIWTYGRVQIFLKNWKQESAVGIK
jgi:hypothetical protein